MRGLYGAALLLGVVALIAWLVASAIAESVRGWDWLDPERRPGPLGRPMIGGLVGFGMAGLSASFAGWPTWAAALAALAGAGAAGWYAARFGD